MSDAERRPVPLTGAEISMLIEALDAYEYWQLGDVLPRNNGAVWIPGDLPADEDRYWGAEPDVGPAESDAIDQVRACRALADRLSRILGARIGTVTPGADGG